MKQFWSSVRRLWSNPIGLLGATLTTVAAVLILTAFILDALGQSLNPYNALVAYIFLPGVFVTGLVLIPVGSWLHRKRMAKQGAEVSPWKIDFSDGAHRRVAVFVLAMTLLNSIILSVALYEGYHYTDSVKFCGTLCHSVMNPEYTAYQRSPHARVTCVECHIGGGASWFVKSKMSGLRQVYGVFSGDHHRPIPSPVENLRPARDTCESCHWPEAFHGKKLRIIRSLGDGATPGDPQVSALLMNIGGKDERTGRYTGIHWHVSRLNSVEYLAADEKRREIKRVRVRRPDGSTEEFVKDKVAEPAKDRAWRTMDCIDCHNRPTHIYQTAEQAVDGLLLNGRVPAGLPGLREIGLDAVRKPWESETAARAGIAKELAAAYQAKFPEVAAAKAADIAKAAEALSGAWALNVFPSMKVTWGTYATQLGHQNDGGCFRCHDEEHKSGKDHVIGQDCDMCHELMSEKQRLGSLDDRVRKFIK